MTGRPHGEVLSRITNDIDTLSQSLNQSITQLITSATMLVGILVMMFFHQLDHDPGVPADPAPFSGDHYQDHQKSQKYFKAQQEYLGHVNGQVEEVFGSHNVVKAFNAEKKGHRGISKNQRNPIGSAWKSQFYPA